MKNHLSLLWILASFIACTGSIANTPDNMSVDSQAETAIDSTGDTPLPQDTIQEINDAKSDQGTDINATDTYVPPKDCKDQLTKYQCLKDSDCAKGEVCSGVMSCGSEGCFGNCKVYPGTCLPAYKATFCSPSKQCATEEYYTCVGARACNGSGCLASTIPGLCRYTGPGRCYTDTDCANGKYCAQAIYCRSGPCWGQDFAGKCQDKPSKGCLDDRDCKTNRECHNATLCTMFDSCRSQPGTCMQTEPCSTQKKCSNPLHSFCENAYECNFDKCIYTASEGYCIAQPGATSCWTDKDCGSTERPLCKGARPCKPGSLCSTTGHARTGYCVTNISPKGIKVRMPTQIIAGQPFPVAIINYTGVTISVRKTYTFNYQQEMSDGSFIDRCPDKDKPPSCSTAGPFIAITDGGVFTRMEKVSIPGTFRIQFDVFPSSAQGFLPKNPNSMGSLYHLFMFVSGDFTVLAKPQG